MNSKKKEINKKKWTSAPKHLYSK